MPKGPCGEKRPADAIGCAIMCARIATGEVDDIIKPISGRKKSGEAGAKARKLSLSKASRREIAKKAASARWK